MITHHERYRSRTYPFSMEVVQAWLDLLPAVDTIGISIEVCDATKMGTKHSHPLAVSGQYIASRAKFPRNGNPSGLIKLFTVKVRYLKHFAIYDDKCRSDSRHNMEFLAGYLFGTLAHEIGHYVDHRKRGRLATPGEMAENLASYYAYKIGNPLTDQAVAIAMADYESKFGLGG